MLANMRRSFAESAECLCTFADFVGACESLPFLTHGGKVQMLNETPNYGSLPVDSLKWHVSVNSASERIIIPHSGFFGMIK